MFRPLPSGERFQTYNGASTFSSIKKIKLEMKLTETQIKDYHTNGYLIIDSLFTPSEVEKLKNAIQSIADTPVPNIIREENGDIRSVFAPHQFIEEYEWLYKQERLVRPAQQLLDNSSIYLYQYKLNNKKAFDGGVWEWHQDFPFWHIDDGVKEVAMLSAMVLLQDTEQVQGPLMFIPESHKSGIATFQNKEHLTKDTIKLENSLNGDLKFTIKNELIKNMVDHSGIKPGIGKVGTTIFFHPNVYHGSSANISPYDRNTAIITYNITSNLPEDRKEKNRPTYICSRNFDAIVQDPRSIEELHK